MAYIAGLENPCTDSVSEVVGCIRSTMEDSGLIPRPKEWDNALNVSIEYDIQFLTSLLDEGMAIIRNHTYITSVTESPEYLVTTTAMQNLVDLFAYILSMQQDNLIFGNPLVMDATRHALALMKFWIKSFKEKERQ